MDRLCALALVACDAALVDAAVSPAGWDGARAGIVLGTVYGCHATNEEYYKSFLDGAASPRLFAYTLPSSPAGEISIHYGLRGPASTVIGSPLDEAVRHFAAGRADRMLVAVAEVATPLLAKILGRADLRDTAAAILVETAQVAEARGARGRPLAAGLL